MHDSNGTKAIDDEKYDEIRIIKRNRVKKRTQHEHQDDSKSPHYLLQEPVRQRSLTKKSDKDVKKVKAMPLIFVNAG